MRQVTGLAHSKAYLSIPSMQDTVLYIITHLALRKSLPIFSPPAGEYVISPGRCVRTIMTRLSAPPVENV